MMNNDYIEYLIKRRMTPGGIAARVGSVLLVIVCVMLYSVLNFIAFGMSVVAAYLVRYTFQTTDVEFEYTYFSGECRFDKIMAKRKRKSMAVMEMDKVELIAPENDDRLSEYEKKEYQLKKFTSGEEDAKRYTAFMRNDSNLIKIVFEPSEEIIKSMQAYSPRKVIV